MTLEQFNNLLTKPEIPMDIWYEFFLEKGGSPIGIENFMKYFSVITQPGETMVTGTDGQPRWCSLRGAYQKFYDHYKAKFGL